MRKIRFVTPYAVTQGKRTYYRAMVNGQWIEGDYVQVWREFTIGKDEYHKRCREMRKQAIKDSLKIAV